MHFVLEPARIAIDRLGSAQLLGFRRAFLVKESGQKNVEAHLEKLGFPILHRRLEEMCAAEILRHGHRRQSMFHPIAVVFPVAEEGLPSDEREEEQAQRHD